MMTTGPAPSQAPTFAPQERTPLTAVDPTAAPPGAADAWGRRGCPSGRMRSPYARPSPRHDSAPPRPIDVVAAALTGGTATTAALPRRLLRGGLG
jgi:hypothetical protein